MVAILKYQLAMKDSMIVTHSELNGIRTMARNRCVFAASDAQRRAYRPAVTAPAPG